MTHLREELGAYVLEALEPAEAAAVREHLDDCAECRAEHARLAPLPELLELAEPLPAGAAVPEPPPSLERAVLDRYPAAARRQRRRRRAPAWLRPGLAGALAGALATLAVLAVTGAFGGEPAAREVALSAANASGTARLTPTEGGTRVDLQVRGLAPTRGGAVYELWFGREDGRVSAGTFSVGESGEVEVVLTSAARPAEYARIGVTREPDGLDPAGNGPPVLRGTL